MKNVKDFFNDNTKEWSEEVLEDSVLERNGLWEENFSEEASRALLRFPKAQTLWAMSP